MTEIKLHNSATRQKEVFAPLDPMNVRMYVCGPTVYDRAHIGNARPVVVFDVLYRLLRHVYGVDHVAYVRNITDIDDKINKRGPEDFPGLPPLEAIAKVTDKTSQWFVEDMRALGCLDPDAQPRATQFVPQMVAMIEQLIARGHAYAAEGHVLFEVATYADYGALSGRSTDDMIAGARVEVAPYKRDPMDFVLWKPSGDDLPGWDSPWGRGRPGWHIECSAMSSELLGDSFDIHGGGADLLFPHHENEIAQSCCAAPDAGFAKVWLHNGMINVDGRKMSKSLGNFLTVEDLRGQAPAEVLRLALLGTHYRGTLDWTQQKLDEAEDALMKWGALVEGIEPDEKAAVPVIAALTDDLNTPLAVAGMHRMARDGEYAGLAAAMAMLNLSAPNMDVFNLILDSDRETVEAVLELRGVARAEKNFELADQLRDALNAAGVIVMDRPGGEPEWKRGSDFDVSELVKFL